jgi:hypothetical protein
MTRQIRQIDILRLAGQCANGAERDGGRLYHGVPAFESGQGWIALCGVKPGRRSAGWWAHPGARVTCPKCRRKLEAELDYSRAKAESEGARAADGVEDAARTAAHFAGLVLAIEWAIESARRAK